MHGPKLLSSLVSFALFLGVAATARAAPVISPRVSMVAHGQLLSTSIGDGRDVRALVTVRIPGGADRLRAAGFDAQPVTARLATVRASATELGSLIALPDVEQVEERRLLGPTLDMAGPAVAAPTARQESGIDGSGVLVAIIDTGVDFRHPDLRTAAGKTRIAALLDLSLPPDTRHPELGMLPGRVWLRDEIDAVLAAEAAHMTPPVAIGQRDTNGHGTHVAGIATSNGLATGNGLPAGRYVGIAPGADLLVVQATHGGNSFSDADVLAGARFAVEYATRVGQPLVLNLSLGGPGGAHDGTSNLESGLDELFPANAPGRAVVVAVGNEGNHDLHAAGWRLSGETVVTLSVPESSDNAASLSIEMWFSGALALTVESPKGEKRMIPAQGADVFDLGESGRVALDTGGSGPRDDGRTRGSLVIQGVAGKLPAAGIWKLHLAGSASRWDLWIVESLFSSGTPFFTDHIAVDDRLALPATAQNVIAAGSFVSRASWTTVDGRVATRDVTVGAPSSFTGSGPTFDGRFAPDLVAPGEFVISALSADTRPADPSSAFYVNGMPKLGIADDGMHGVLHGTSQAAPMVTGAAALLLARRPSLTPTALREVLRTAAGGLTTGWSTRSGFGKLDVQAALRLLEGGSKNRVSSSTSSVGVSRDALPPGDGMTRVSVTPRDVNFVPLGRGHAVDITADYGVPAGPVVDAGFGRYERSFIAQAPRGAMATINATVDGVLLDAHPVVYFVEDRSEIGRPFVAAGGCSAAKSPITRPALLVLSLLVLLATRGRRNSRLG